MNAIRLTVYLIMSGFVPSFALAKSCHKFPLQYVRKDGMAVADLVRVRGCSKVSKGSAQ